MITHGMLLFFSVLRCFQATFDCFSEYLWTSESVPKLTCTYLPTITTQHKTGTSGVRSRDLSVNSGTRSQRSYPYNTLSWKSIRYVPRQSFAEITCYIGLFSEIVLQIKIYLYISLVNEIVTIRTKL